MTPRRSSTEKTHAGVQGGANSAAGAAPAVEVGLPKEGGLLRGVIASRGLAVGRTIQLTRPEVSVAENGAGIAHENAEFDRARSVVRDRRKSTAGSSPGKSLARTWSYSTTRSWSRARALRYVSGSYGFRLALGDSSHGDVVTRASARAYGRASSRSARSGVAGTDGAERCGESNTGVAGALDSAHQGVIALAARGSRCDPSGGNLYGRRWTNLSRSHPGGCHGYSGTGGHGAGAPEPGGFDTRGVGYRAGHAWST